MIDLYTGTGGSGKSYHMALDAYNLLRHRKINIITTFTFNTELASLTRLGWLKYRLQELTRGKLHFKKLNSIPLKGSHYYVKLEELTVPYLLQFARDHHDPKRGEGQTLVMVDEAEHKWNCRQYNAKDRPNWLKFFPVSRHLAYDFILATQQDRMLDRQVRALCEREFIHRKIRNFKFLGWLMAMMAGGNLFLVRKMWYVNKSFINSSTLRYSRRIAALYDTFEDFAYGDYFAELDRAAGSGGHGGPTTAAPAKGGAAAAMADLSQVADFIVKGGGHGCSIQEEPSDTNTSDVPGPGDPAAHSAACDG